MRGINLPLRLPPTALQHIFVALPTRSMDFSFKTDGCQILGVLRNLSNVPQHLSPRFDSLHVGLQLHAIQPQIQVLYSFLLHVGGCFDPLRITS